MFLRAKCVGCDVAEWWRFWRVFLFSGQGKRQGWQKYRTNQGWLQSSKLQNLNVKMISGEMNGTEMKWSVGGAKRNR